MNDGTEIVSSAGFRSNQGGEFRPQDDYQDGLAQVAAPLAAPECLPAFSRRPNRVVAFAFYHRVGAKDPTKTDH